MALNDEVVTLQSEIAEAFEAYSIAAMTKDEELIELRRNELNLVAVQNVKKVDEYKATQKNQVFLKAARDNFDFYKTISKNQLVIMERWYLADSLTEQQNDSLAMVIEEINLKENELDARFRKAQRDYSHENNFEIAE